jgi:hypothetical protein
MTTQPVNIARATPSRVEALQATAVVWGGAAIFVLSLSLLSDQMGSFGDFLGYLVGTATSVVLSLLIYEAFRGVRRLPGWAAVLALLLVLAAVSVAQAAADYYAQFLLKATIAPESTTPQLGAPFLARTVFFYFVLDALNAALLWMLAASHAGREQARALAEAKAEAAEARAQALDAELRALRLQLNPHFLFNTLNGLTALIEAGRNSEAQAMTARLSEFLRTALVTAASGKTPLAEEIDALTHYLEVEEARLGAIDLEIDAPDHLQDALVPELILQPLLENALVHGLERGGGRIRLEARADGGELRLRLENPVASTGSTSEGHGIGQFNVSARLRACYGPRAGMTVDQQPGSYRVEIRLPLEAAA